MAKEPIDPADDDEALPHPRRTAALFGHAEAERTLLDAYRSGRIPHAWLIGGVPGIGKASLAYRMARFVLAHPEPAMPQVQRATSLEVPADHPAFRRVAGQAHSDLLVLERTLNDKGKLRQNIAVDDVRRTVSFFGSTAGEGGWRVAIVDSVDDLNKESANALLKVLEEPPRKSLMLLVSHAAGRVLPTIRSRCRTLMRPLAVDEVTQAAAVALGADVPDSDLQAAAEAADGSVARALSFLDGGALELRRQIGALLERLPQVDARALHALGDKLPTGDVDSLGAFVEAVNAWLAERLHAGPQDVRRMDRVAEVWEQVNRAARDTEAFNLDRKPLVFSVFGLLADAARG
jgi:DNA polymerase III subunit delta'